MSAAMSSRARMLAALRCEEPDYVPCCFSAFQALRQRCGSLAEFLARQLEMGLDAVVELPSPPVRHHPDVWTEESIVEQADGPYPLLRRVYHTPAGSLEVVVSKTADWPWGDHVPLFDDYVMARARKPLVTPEDSLDAVRYLLGPAGEKDVAWLRDEYSSRKRLAAERDLLTMACYGMMGDVACWLAGIEPLTLAAADAPGFVDELLGIIEEWNRGQVALMLAEGVDLLVRRAWYEHADVWSPAQYARFLLPGLQRDVEQVHAAGARFGYLMSCNSLPLVDMIVDAGVDVLLGVDPAQDRTMDLAALKRKTARKMALWGGVCGYLTVERGTPEEIREQVRRAMAALAPGGGFILAPVTNVREDNDRVWRNIAALVEEWKRLVGGSGAG